MFCIAVHTLPPCHDNFYLHNKYYNQAQFKYIAENPFIVRCLKNWQDANTDKCKSQCFTRRICFICTVTLHARLDCILDSGISKALRQYIVGYVPNRDDTSTPNIHLKGKWLREAGSETRAHLTVKITEGCIVIVLDSDEMDDLKHEQAALCQQLREIKQTNPDMKNAAKAALRGMRV